MAPCLDRHFRTLRLYSSAVVEAALGAPKREVSGHLQVRGEGAIASSTPNAGDRDGKRHTSLTGRAHVKDSGRRTSRNAVIWWAAPGACPSGHLTPKMAEAALEAILDAARSST